MKWLIAFLACIGIAQAQIIQHNISDDGYAHVPLQFGFPLYGRIFTDSYMFSNGVVGFGSVNNHWCCSGYDLVNANGYQFNYSIMGLQTDLINYGSGRFLTEGTPQYQRYKWENISEYGAPQNLNTFGIEIRPSGFIGMYYEQVNISPWRAVTIGVTGDTTQREFSQLYHGNGFSQANFSHIIEVTGSLCASNPLSSPTCAGYQEAYLSQQCSLNPLFSANCAGYEQAYFLQQCSLNVLYDRNCVGYEQAYQAQQCSLNPLYATTCQGYAEAYHNQQCSQNPLYATTCQGYQQAYHNQQCSLNPLYATTCIGYEAAYFNQQCSANPLYNQGCTGYAEAYFTYQCTQNPLYNSRCNGYAEAYRLQQCGLNPLYSTTCVGYQQAYFAQQCNLNQLYSPQCPNYAQAYFNEQCRLNPLYDRNCTGYSEAYALANVVPATTTNTVSTTTPSVQVNTTGTVTLETPVVADPVVNEVITRPINVNAPIQQTNTVSTATSSQAEPKQEKKAETKQVSPTAKQTARNEVLAEAPKIVTPVHEYKAPIILDLAYMQMVKKPIKDNNRAMYNLIMNSQHKHEEMVDEQYRR